MHLFGEMRWIVIQGEWGRGEGALVVNQRERGRGGKAPDCEPGRALCMVIESW